MSFPEDHTGGDCFEAAWNNQTDDVYGDGVGLLICHGIATGFGPLDGYEYTHGWNEYYDDYLDGVYVIDTSNGNDIRMPAWEYYRLMGIDYDSVHKYDSCEAYNEAARTMVYGPWAPELRWEHRKVALNDGGDCFVVALENVVDDNDLYLCHGIATGQGPIEGIRFSHAWNETLDGYVIDQSNGNDIVMPRDMYYSIGHIDPSEVRYYNWKETLEMVVEHGTYGPWDSLFDHIASKRKVSGMARKPRMKSAGFDRYDILDAFGELSRSQGFYGRLLESLYELEDEDPAAFDEYMTALEEQGFDDVVDLVMYVEAKRAGRKRGIARRANTTQNGLQYDVVSEIDPSWSGYEKAVAKGQMLTYGKVFVDEYGSPIDDEYAADEAAEDYGMSLSASRRRMSARKPKARRVRTARMAKAAFARKVAAVKPFRRAYRRKTALKIIMDSGLDNFEFWAGAKSTRDMLTFDDLQQIEFVLEDIYPDGIDETALNDIFWFDDDFIARCLGYDDAEEMHEDRL